MQSDLNLLRTLEALLEEQNVTRAAERLHLTPPAMSRALGRLRRATGDEILVRTGRTMTPTPRALALRAEVHAVLARAEAVLAPDTGLDLARLDRTFAVRCHDALTPVVGTAVLAVTRRDAPGVRVRLLPEGSTDTDDLRHGRVDLEVNAGRVAGLDVRSAVVGHDRLVIAAAAGHPALDGGLASYLAAEHVTVSRRGRLADAVDARLGEAGYVRRVVASVPTVAAAASLVAGGGLVATGPLGAFAPLVPTLGLGTAPPPIPLPDVPLVLSWAARYDDDPAHGWLRGVVRGALQDAG